MKGACQEPQNPNTAPSNDQTSTGNEKRTYSKKAFLCRLPHKIIARYVTLSAKINSNDCHSCRVFHSCRACRACLFDRIFLYHPFFVVRSGCIVFFERPNYCFSPNVYPFPNGSSFSELLCNLFAWGLVACRSPETLAGHWIVRNARHRGLGLFRKLFSELTAGMNRNVGGQVKIYIFKMTSLLCVVQKASLP